jgi:hypothetical protein
MLVSRDTHHDGAAASYAKVALQRHGFLRHATHVGREEGIYF